MNRGMQRGERWPRRQGSGRFGEFDEEFLPNFKAVIEGIGRYIPQIENDSGRRALARISLQVQKSD